MDFLRTRTETTVPPRAPSATTREREERERESCLHCEPDLRLTVTQLLRRDDSCLALQFFFHPSNRFQFALYAQSWFWRAGELLSPRPQLHAEKYRKKKSLSSVSHSPTLAQSVFFFLFFIPTAPRWTGHRSHVQEEGSEGQGWLQEPQGVAEQREDGERSGRRRRSVLRTRLSQQTVPQQQRGVLWHRLQGELRVQTQRVFSSIKPSISRRAQVWGSEQQKTNKQKNIFKL